MKLSFIKQAKRGEKPKCLWWSKLKWSTDVKMCLEIFKIEFLHIKFKVFLELLGTITYRLIFFFYIYFHFVLWDPKRGGDNCFLFQFGALQLFWPINSDLGKERGGCCFAIIFFFFNKSLLFENLTVSSTCYQRHWL